MAACKPSETMGETCPTGLEPLTHELFLELVGPLLAFACSRGAGSEAEDIVQDVFVRFSASEQARRMQSMKDMRRYLFQSVNNAVTDFLRHGQTKKQQMFGGKLEEGDNPDQHQDESSADPAEELMKKDDKKFVRQTLKEGLEDHEFRLYELYFAQQMTMDEVANILRSPKSTVQSRLRALLMKAKKLLTSEFGIRNPQTLKA